MKNSINLFLHWTMFKILTVIQKEHIRINYFYNVHYNAFIKIYLEVLK